MNRDGQRKPTKEEKLRQEIYKEVKLELDQADIDEKLKMAEQRGIIGCMSVLSNTLRDFNNPRVKIDRF